MARYWSPICLLFFVINIKILIDESYDTIYKMVNQNESIQYLECFNLSDIISNKTRMNPTEIKNEFNYHLRWIQKNKKDKRDRFIRNETIENIINETKSRDYLIYQDRICFIFKNESDFRSLDRKSVV